MPKIRHIAYRAEDVEAVAQFFAKGFGMDIVQRRDHGAIDLSDGTLNITVLPATLPQGEGRPHTGIDHIGFTAEDDAQAQALVEAAGGKQMNTINLGNEVHFETKFQGPEGIVVDVGHWPGTAPVAEEAIASKAR